MLPLPSNRLVDVVEVRVTAECLIGLGKSVINAGVKLVLVVLVVAYENEIIGVTRLGGKRVVIKDSKSRGIDPVQWDDIGWGKGCSAEPSRGLDGSRGIVQHRLGGTVESGEIALPFQESGDCRGANRADCLLNALVIDKEKRAIFYNWAAQCSSVLVAAELGLPLTHGSKVIPGIQRFVTEKFPDAAVKFVRPGPRR
jgi:hypothetical protein